MGFIALTNEESHTPLEFIGGPAAFSAGQVTQIDPVLSGLERLWQARNRGFEKFPVFDAIRGILDGGRDCP